ncbi:hypothetical protein M758_6G041400 [Ceratodon purpureus]|nr:hypothetical protein M758_6G041400 [Ceratodon purpureus]
MGVSNVVAMPVALAGAAAYGLTLLFSKWRQGKSSDRFAPRVVLDQYGKLKDIESFGSYVVRQLGLDEASHIAQTVSKAAEGYLREDRNITGDTKEIVFSLVAGPTQEDNEKEICQDMLQELEICVVTYFSFHWKHASAFIEKVMSNGVQTKKLHKAVLTALRKQRYEKVLESLKTKRKIHTLIEEMKLIGKADESVPDEGVVTIPAESSKRSPVVLFIGGGMGAGKSTVVKEILSSSFWSGVIKDAVVVEADAFKETDVIYRTLSTMAKGDVSGTSELVHQFSTDAANSLLVSALNEGRDVIFDGTMSWEPFVRQTMDMVRDIHNRRYRMGPGYKKNADGTEIEKYWELDDSDCAVEAKSEDGKRPYRIEFVGVVCDAHLAVVRGMRRAIATKRGVPVKGQLRSHKMFAQSAEKYMSMVDSAKIFSTTAWNGPAELIAVKDGREKKLLIDVDTYPGARCLGDLNTDSGSVTELYSKATDSNLVNLFWQHEILDPKRKSRQERLRAAILANAPTSVLLEKTMSQLTQDEIKAMEK